VWAADFENSRLNFFANDAQEEEQSAAARWCFKVYSLYINCTKVQKSAKLHFCSF
jgi:hypothetical protein